VVPYIATTAAALPVSVLVGRWWRRRQIIPRVNGGHNQPRLSMLKITGLLSRFFEYLARSSRLLFSNTQSNDIALKSCGWEPNKPLS
jgi:hypothetical protein